MTSQPHSQKSSQNSRLSAKDSRSLLLRLQVLQISLATSETLMRLRAFQLRLASRSITLPADLFPAGFGLSEALAASEKAQSLVTSFSTWLERENILELSVPKCRENHTPSGCCLISRESRKETSAKESLWDRISSAFTGDKKRERKRTYAYSIQCMTYEAYAQSLPA